MCVTIQRAFVAVLCSTYISQLHSLSLTRIIDLRSDTVTRPTAAMRTAMFEAEVGDDVFRDDPTVIKLEQKMSVLFQKDEALFFPSGTMSNLAATMSWCTKRGSEMILGDSSHLFLYEQGGLAQLAGVVPRCLRNERDGSINLDCIEKAVRQNNIHFPVTEVIALEDTHNFCGGRVLPQGYLEAVAKFARSRDIAVHLDGARIWNAAAASQTSLHNLVEGADSVSVCLSKGLGAPSGSVLLGPKNFIEKARRCRKVLGGGMRQVGILAAAGLTGIADFEAGLLLPDHSKAKQLASAISEISGFTVALDSVETNIILVGVNDEGFQPAMITAMLKDKNVLVLPFGDRCLRLVTHRDILTADIEVIIAAFRDVAVSLSPKPDMKASTPSFNLSAVPDVTSVQPILISELPIRDSVEKSDLTRRLIETVLQNENVFRPFLSAREIKEIVDGAEGIRVSPGETVIRRGDDPQFFYIIESGRVDRISEDGLSSPVWETLTDGCFFGEIALIYDAPRSATVVAAEETVLWRIHKKYFFFVCKALDGAINLQEAYANKAKENCIPIVIKKKAEDLGSVKVGSSDLSAGQLTGTALQRTVSNIESRVIETNALVLTRVAGPIVEDGTCVTLTDPVNTVQETPDAAAGIDYEALLAWENLETERVERRHAELLIEDAPLKNGDEDEQNYEEVFIHGMSLSDNGFCVLLRGVVCERVLRVLVTPSDPMSDGLDIDQVDTSEAVTLLQLLQGIDVESVLARDALATKFTESGPARQQYVLQRVMIDNVDSSKTFHAVLQGSSALSGVPHASAPMGDIAFPVSVVPQHSFDHPVYESLVHYPHVSATPSLAPLPEELATSASSEILSLAIKTQGQLLRHTPVSSRVDKEVELDSAFEAIALALRHSAVVEVKSSLLQDESNSFSVRELASYFPKLVKSDIPLEDRGRFGADYDSHSEIERLQRRLQEAIRQGNTDKIDPIKKQLDFYTHIDGRPVLVLPPPHVFLAPVIGVPTRAPIIDTAGHSSLTE